jgi:hypothetical protein
VITFQYFLSYSVLVMQSYCGLCVSHCSVQWSHQIPSQTLYTWCPDIALSIISWNISIVGLASPIVVASKSYFSCTIEDLNFKMTMCMTTHCIHFHLSKSNIQGMNTCRWAYKGFYTPRCHLPTVVFISDAIVIKQSFLSCRNSVVDCSKHHFLLV